MKNLEEIYEMINSRSGKVWNKKEIAIMVARVYAQQACEDLRERIAEQAKVKTVATPLGDYHEVNKETILNTEIILP